MQRSWRGKQDLIQVSREPDARRIVHRIQSASLLVVEVLQTAKVKQSGRGRITALTRAGNDACRGNADRKNVRVLLLARIQVIEKRFAHAVGDAWPGKSLVKQNRPVRNSIVEFF